MQQPVIYSDPAMSHLPTSRSQLQVFRSSHSPGSQANHDAKQGEKEGVHAPTKAGLGIKSVCPVY